MYFDSVLSNPSFLTYWPSFCFCSVINWYGKLMMQVIIKLVNEIVWDRHIYCLWLEIGIQGPLNYYFLKTLWWWKHVKETFHLHRTAFWEWSPPLRNKCLSWKKLVRIMSWADGQWSSYEQSVLRCIMSLHIRSGERGGHTHCHPTSPQLLQFQVPRLPDQEVICANQQICLCNLSYMLMFSAQELSTQVRISTGNGCILRALR